MDIVMMGQSQAGKTSYISAMYHEMSTGAGDFNIRADRTADHQRLRQLAERMRYGRYPDATDRRNVYNLQLWHSANRVVDFVRRDYRGGAIVESSDSPQAMELRSDMTRADGLVIMIDSTELTTGQRARARVRPLIATTMRLLSAREDIIPIVIVLTKWDLVAAAEKAALDAASELLGDLVKAVSESNNIHGAVIPVACGTQPINVALPVLWCLYVGIAVRGNLLQQNIEYYGRVAEMAQRNRGFVDRVVSAVKRQPTWDQILAASRLQVWNDMQALQPLIVPSERLKSLFEPVFTF